MKLGSQILLVIKISCHLIPFELFTMNYVQHKREVDVVRDTSMRFPHWGMNNLELEFWSVNEY